MEWLEPFRLTLKSLLLPPGGIIILLLIGLWFRHYRSGRVLSGLATLLLYLLSTPAVTYWIATQVESSPPVLAADIKKSGAQALLVLTASATLRNPEISWQARPSSIGLERLNYALQLHRKTGLPVVVSGGKLTIDSAPLAKIYADWLRDQGVDVLAMETRSANSWENIRFSLPILKQHGINKVAIVTHAFHMPRAMQAAKASGLDAVAAPFGFVHKRVDGQQIALSSIDWMPDANSLATNYLLLHELTGRWWYAIKSLSQDTETDQDQASVTPPSD